MPDCRASLYTCLVSCKAFTCVRISDVSVQGLILGSRAHSRRWSRSAGSLSCSAFILACDRRRDAPKGCPVFSCSPEPNSSSAAILRRRSSQPFKPRVPSLTDRTRVIHTQHLIYLWKTRPTTTSDTRKQWPPRSSSSGLRRPRLSALNSCVGIHPKAHLFCASWRSCTKIERLRQVSWGLVHGGHGKYQRRLQTSRILCGSGELS